MASNTNKNDDQKFKLISSDQKTFSVSKAIIQQNEVLNTLMECGTNFETGIPLQNVDAKSLRNIINFCELFTNSPPYNPDEKVNLRTDAKVIKFMDKLKNDELPNLLLAANYLNNKRLIDAGLLKIHNALEGLTVEGIRKVLCVENDFTEEEMRSMDNPREQRGCYIP